MEIAKLGFQRGGFPLCALCTAVSQNPRRLRRFLLRQFNSRGARRERRGSIGRKSL